MEKELYNKIKSYLKNNKIVELSVGFGMDAGIDLNHNLYVEDFNFFEEKFEDWHYGQLADLIIDSDSTGSYFNIDFELINDILYSNVITEISDPCSIGLIDEHYKEELVTELFEEVLTNHLKINIDEFDEGFIEFEIDFNGEAFSYDVYYKDEKLNLAKDNKVKIMKEAQKIMDDWISTEWDSYEIYIDRNTSLFDITGTESYNFEIKLKANSDDLNS